jgi:peptidoglycan hydrolase-like protein with peptidoglycan-binding domain
MKKLVVRAAILAMFTAGLTTTIGIAGGGVAMACDGNMSPSSQLAASLPQVRYGSRGGTVLALQLALRKEGYNLQGTGTYAGLTLNAVRDYQRKHGIKDSGIVGSKTWQALVGSKEFGVTKKTPPSFSITPGEKNERKVATLVNTLERIYPYSTRPEESNTYGPERQKMVKDFQRRVGIKASGIVGPQTWAAMYRAVSVAGNWGC